MHFIEQNQRRSVSGRFPMGDDAVTVRVNASGLPFPGWPHWEQMRVVVVFMMRSRRRCQGWRSHRVAA
jgi:hypothetical protein